MNSTSTHTALPRHRLQAVIFDWAGTLVDFGSLAPTQIFVEAFATFGIHVTLAQARGPMGLSKRDHIRTLLQEPAIDAQWRQRFGAMAGPKDIDALYERFMPMQIEKVGNYSNPIPGALETLAEPARAGRRGGTAPTRAGAIVGSRGAPGHRQRCRLAACIARDRTAPRNRCVSRIAPASPHIRRWRSPRRCSTATTSAETIR